MYSDKKNNGQQISTIFYKILYKRYLSYSIMLLLKNGCLDNKQSKILKMSQNDRQKTIPNNFDLGYDTLGIADYFICFSCKGCF